jgi:hypothetical protein
MEGKFCQMAVSDSLLQYRTGTGIFLNGTSIKITSSRFKSQFKMLAAQFKMLAGSKHFKFFFFGPEKAAS